MATTPFVLHSLSRVGSELSRLGRLACADGAADLRGASGGGRRGGGLRRAPQEAVEDPEGSSTKFF